MVSPTDGQFVLVVEDDPGLRDLYRSTLRSAGYTVVAVDDGIAALRAVEARHPVAVVLDLALPRLNGRDVQKELKAHPETSRIPIIVVSGNDVSDLHQDDFASVLAKPISGERLIAAVHECLRNNWRSAL
jgi:CheY-like chemotaxis protein